VTDRDWDWSQGTRELAQLIADIRAGKLPEMTPERRRLAEEAVRSNEARKNEDVDAWAKKLAADVADLDD
jgi:hypothetical protein